MSETWIDSLAHSGSAPLESGCADLRAERIALSMALARDSESLPAVRADSVTMPPSHCWMALQSGSASPMTSNTNSQP